MGQALGCLAIASLFVVPIWLQVSGQSPFWVVPLAFLFNIFWLPPEHRARFNAAAAASGRNVSYVTLVKPLFWALWVAIGVYAATYALNRWVI